MKVKNLLFLLPILLVGCYPNQNSVPVTMTKLYSEIKEINSKGIGPDLYEIRFKNHDYILVDGQGKSLIHSESCNCKNK